jgi:putative restriction endonuclease
MAILSKKQLLGLLLKAVDASGWQVLVLDSDKPFGMRLFRNDEKGFDIYIYIWNCTHGGGKARAKDEYRIQFTGVVPTIHVGATTLLLGWHDGYEVFAGWDITRHSGQDSESPSAQVKEVALANAHTNAFSIHRRNNRHYRKLLL